jgi:hypothetical protein
MRFSAHSVLAVTDSTIAEQLLSLPMLRDNPTGHAIPEDYCGHMQTLRVLLRWNAHVTNALSSPLDLIFFAARLLGMRHDSSEFQTLSDASY